MKNVSAFKKSIKVGQKYSTTHKFIGNNPSALKEMGTREVGLVNSVGFAFKNPVSGELSYCDWPKAKEFSYEDGVITITKEEFCQLTYKEVA